MAEQITPISRAISDVLTGAYGKKRMTQDELAERAGMSIWTLQKKLKARAPITATDLVILSKAIGISPSKILEEALEDLAEAEKLTSEGVASLSEQRRKKKPSEMTEAEMEGIPNAANTDPEIGHDEPDNI